MLTLFKKLFIWWNQETFGTELKTIFFGKLVGKDSFGNKYYESKSGKRWIIYIDEVDASKIPSEWYSWIHFTNNRIENKHDLEKYNWNYLHKNPQSYINKKLNCNIHSRILEKDNYKPSY